MWVRVCPISDRDIVFTRRCAPNVLDGWLELAMFTTIGHIVSKDIDLDEDTVHTIPIFTFVSLSIKRLGTHFMIAVMAYVIPSPAGRNLTSPGTSNK